MLRFNARTICLAAGFAVWCSGPTVAAQDADVVEVTVTGKGITQEQARRDALRQALEEGGGIEIASHSQTDNFELVRDTILSRADGIVTDYEILERKSGVGGFYYCTIRAMVRRSAIAQTWGDIQNVLDQIGRPGIAVHILERIDGVVQDSSILETRIEHYLLEKGFVVYAGKHLQLIGEKESADAQAEQNITKVQAIAKDFGTQIFITGTAQANSAGVREVAGTSLAMYNCDATIKMYYTDTAQLCASESLPNTRGGARGHHTISPQAGKMALENAGNALVAKCVDDVLRQWATRISSGGLVRLEIEGMRVSDALKLRKHLQGLDKDKIMSVDGPDATKGLTTYRIKAKMTATDLAMYLIEGEWESLIEIVDLKPNRIQAKWIGK